MYHVLVKCRLSQTKHRLNIILFVLKHFGEILESIYDNFLCDQSIPALAYRYSFFSSRLIAELRRPTVPLLLFFSQVILERSCGYLLAPL